MYSNLLQVFSKLIQNCLFLRYIIVFLCDIAMKMANAQVLILNKVQIAQKVNRIAYQILEDNMEESEIILAGMWERGYKFALRLQHVLQQISNIRIITVAIDEEGFRKKMYLPVSMQNDQWKNKVVVLVDDVLNSGKTLTYGLGLFLNSAPKKVRTAVLIDRSHNIFPIATDFVGLRLATVLKEHIDVLIDVSGEEDRVYLS